MSTHENWLPVEGYGDRYQVSDAGRIRRTRDGYVLRPHTVQGGYLRVSLAGGPQRNVLVHLVVARAFLGPCPEGHEVDHRFGIKTDNRASELRYLTPAQNVRESFASGRRRPARGEKHASSRLTEEDVKEIRSSPLGKADLALRYAVNYSTIHRIIKRKTWSHIT